MSIFPLADYLFYPVVKILWIFYYFPMMIIGKLRRKQVCKPLCNPPEVTQITGAEIARRIAQKEVTCRYVIETYITRMKEVNRVINAIVQERFEEALQDADLLDERLWLSKKSAEEWLKEFPLLGVPVSVKESIAVEGMSHAAGYSLAVGRCATLDANTVQRCRKAGAIIMAVTNTPELGFHWETYNSTTGMTTNPYNTQMTPGGSCGGEAALIAAGGSVIGLGSDFAGSLRIPAHFCGVFCHKPSAHVIDTTGHFPLATDREKANSHLTIGPMCRYSTDLLPMLQVITREDFQSALNLSMKVEISNVKIFFIKEFGSILCSNLDSQISTRFDRLLDSFRRTYKLKVKPLRKTVFKDSLWPAVHTFLQIDDFDFQFPKNLLTGCLAVLFGCSKISANIYISAFINSYSHTVSASKYAKCNSLLEKLREELEDTLGDDGVILMPVFNRTAGYHYTMIPQTFDVMNTIIFSALGMPVTVCPIGWHTNGLPFGIQVITKRFNDRLSIAVAEEIEKICGGWKMP